MTKCKVLQSNSSLFAVTLRRNPVILLQSVIWGKIVYGHMDYYHNKNSAKPHRTSRKY